MIPALRFRPSFKSGLWLLNRQSNLQVNNKSFITRSTNTRWINLLRKLWLLQGKRARYRVWHYSIFYFSSDVFWAKEDLALISTQKKSHSRNKILSSVQWSRPIEKWAERKKNRDIVASIQCPKPCRFCIFPPSLSVIYYIWGCASRKMQFGKRLKTLKNDIFWSKNDHFW